MSKGIYDLHSPRHNYWGSATGPQTKEVVIAKAQALGLTMKKCRLPDGLNDYEEQHPDRAVIFNVGSEDVALVENV